MLKQLLLTITLVGVAACGSDDNTSGGTAAPDSSIVSDTTAPSESAFPVTVEHKLGSVTIPAMPERVVSLGFKDQDWLYEFGVQPIAVRSWYGIFPNEIGPWAIEAAGGTTPEVLTGEFNFEKIAALQPDLIVGVYAGLTSEIYEKLSAIAPTIGAPIGSVDYQEPWREMTMLIGTALGQAAHAEEVIAEIEAMYEEVKAAHPEFVGATASVAYSWGQDSMGGYSSDDPRAQLLEDLGFVIPEKFDELAGGEFSFPLTLETVNELDGVDASVIIAYTDAENTGRKYLEDSPLYGSMKLSTEGRGIFIDTAAAETAFSFLSPLSIRWMLSWLVPQLAAAVDGDPATPVPASPTEL